MSYPVLLAVMCHVFLCVSPFQPPKKRYTRPVMKSNVVQQRQMRPTYNVPSPAHISSFMMFSGKYRSKKPISPHNPKVCGWGHQQGAQHDSLSLFLSQSVYPPILPSMYKMFSDHEAERVKMVTTHLVEQVCSPVFSLRSALIRRDSVVFQDRMIITMEQEVLRAHQRATNKHPPLSACTVLMENLLGGARGGGGGSGSGGAGSGGGTAAAGAEGGGAGAAVSSGSGASGSRQNSEDAPRGASRYSVYM